MYSGDQIQSLEPSPLHHEGNWGTVICKLYAKQFTGLFCKLFEYVSHAQYHKIITINFALMEKILVSLGIEPVPYE